MTRTLFDDPGENEQFYARALTILVGPGRRMALAVRLCNLAYWLAVIAALGWLVSQALDRRAPVIVHSATLLTPNIAPGTPVRVAYHISRVRTCETDLTWSVYDGAQEVHRFGPQHVAAAGLPGPDSFVHAWTTPADISPGQGRLRVVLAFACPGNYVQSLYPVVLVLPDLAFVIRGEGGGPQNVGVPAGVGTSDGKPPGMIGGSLHPGGSTTSPPGPGTPTPGPGCGMPTGSPGESSPGTGG